MKLKPWYDLTYYKYLREECNGLAWIIALFPVSEYQVHTGLLNCNYLELFKRVSKQSTKNPYLKKR